MAALRTQRDRAMVQAMLLGALRRCEVLGLRLDDVHVGEWRVFVNEGNVATEGESFRMNEARAKGGRTMAT